VGVDPKNIRINKQQGAFALGMKQVSANQEGLWSGPSQSPTD
jgi:hypothetical protein